MNQKEIERRNKQTFNRWWLMMSLAMTLFLSVGLLFTFFGTMDAEKQKYIDETQQLTQRLIDKLEDSTQPLTEYTTKLIARSNEDFLNKDYLIRIYNINKELVYTSQTNSSQTDTIQILPFVDTKQETGEQWNVRMGQGLFTNSQNILLGYISVTNFANHLDQFQGTMLFNSAKIFVIMIGFAILFSYMMTKFVFKPILEFKEQMMSITEENIIQERMVLPEKDDLFFDMTTHMNALLERIAFYIQQQHHFVEDVSHELRTPVAIVEGHLKLLTRWGKNDPAVLEDSLNTSLTELNRMKSLVQEMLDLSRAESATEHYKDAVTLVQDALYSTINNFRLLYPDFKFTVDNDTKRLVNVQMYVNHFEQVLIILLDNAVKYSAERKEIIVSLSISHHQQVEIAVQDFGIGMSSEDQERVFSRFYRVDKARSRSRGGNGLGLSIAKELVISYGGSISLTSKLEHGSIFRIKLPMHSYE